MQELALQYLRKGAILSGHHRNSFREAVRQHFEEKGFADTRISLEQRLNSNSSTIHLQVGVEKGAKLKVAGIHFHGNQAVSSRKLRRLMDTKEARRLFGSARYLPAQLKSGREKLLAHYHTLGYRDALIEQDSLWRDEKGRSWKGSAGRNSGRLISFWGLSRSER